VHVPLVALQLRLICAVHVSVPVTDDEPVTSFVLHGLVQLVSPTDPAGLVNPSGQYVHSPFNKYQLAEQLCMTHAADVEPKLTLCCARVWFAGHAVHAAPDDATRVFAEQVTKHDDAALAFAGVFG